MNELTNRTEFTARGQIAAATNPRTVLIATAVLALFLIPSFALSERTRRARGRTERALHQLEATHSALTVQSAAVAAAKEETDRIMDTVQEGLLLIDSKFVIGPSYSRELASIFRQDHLAGRNLLHILQRLLSEKMFNTTRDYLDLLFNHEQKEKAVLKINPLVDIEVSFPDPAGGFVHRYLGFSFRRIVEDGRVSRVFVAVRDITAQIELENRLREAEQLKQRQMEILLGIVHVDPEDLVQFAEMVGKELETINQALRAEDFATATSDHQNALRDRLNLVCRSVHNIKGNAAYLQIDYFQKSAEAFEAKLADLISRPKLGGDDFLAIVVAQSGMRFDLADLIELRGQLTEMRPAASDAKTGATSESGSSPLAEGLHKLTCEIASELGKEADLHIDDYALRVVSHGRQELVRDTLIQLVRNSLAHGIETPSERLAAGKPAAARLEIHGLPRSEDGLVGLVLRDDGAGLDLERIRQRALAAGLVDPAAAPGDIARSIFAPGFSTRDQADSHSGRGQGMNIVKTRVVDEAGGRIEARSMPGRFCEFALYLPEIPEPALT
jgi:PAS domain-containing protein